MTPPTFLCSPLLETIQKSFSDYHPKIGGLEDSHDQLKFIINFEKGVILRSSKQIFNIVIEIKPAVCELITLENLNLFKQYFEEFLRIKSETLFKKRKKTKKPLKNTGYLQWI